jgi:hypothetical protein
VPLPRSRWRAIGAYAQDEAKFKHRWLFDDVSLMFPYCVMPEQKAGMTIVP